MARLQDAVRGMAGAAVLAAVASPCTATATPEPRSHVFLASSHGPAAPHDWLAAEHVYTEIERRARKLDVSARARIARTLLAEARRAGLDPLVVLAIIHVESSFNPSVVSTAGAVGLMQLLEPTMREVSTRAGLPSADPRDPIANVQAGTRYFAALVRAFSDDVELALMAYNAGPNRIRRYLRAGAVPERFWTYPRKVKLELARLRASLTHRRALVALASTASARPVAAHVQTFPLGETASADPRELRSRRPEVRGEAGDRVAEVQPAHARLLPASSGRPSRRGARVSARGRRAWSVRGRRGCSMTLASR